MSGIDLVKQLMAAVETGDFAAMSRVLSDDFTLEGPTPQPASKAEYIGLMQVLTAAFPDWAFNPTDWSELGDEVHETHNITGTHSGTLNLPMLLPGPVAATGVKFKQYPEPSVWTIKNGQVRRAVVTHPAGQPSGVANLLRQIGVPLPGM